MKRNKLLSIGEVSRMKGVSPKSLRYYERLGILIPAFVDPSSSYRYYAMNQMITVDVIITCVELGIPLKTLTEYIGRNGTLDIGSLLEKGRVTALENIRKAQLSLAQIDSYLEESRAQEQVRHRSAPYLREVAGRSILYAPWNEEKFNAKRYLSLTTFLYEQAAALGTVPLYQWGMCRSPLHDGGHWCVFVEASVEDDALTNKAGSHVEPPSANEGSPSDKARNAGVAVARIPSGTYRGRRIREAGFDSCFHEVFEQASLLSGAIIATEVWDAEMNPDDYVVELLERQ